MQKLIILLALTLTGCITSKKIDRIVNEYYTENNIDEEIESSWVLNSINQIDTFSISERTQAQFIPALFFWYMHVNINTDIADDITTNRFLQYLSSKSDSIELPRLLKNQKLEFEFIQAPSEFYYTHTGSTLIVIVAELTSEDIVILPNSSQYKLKYRVIDASNNVSKEGLVVANNTETPMQNYMCLKSAKNFTWSYLDEYHKHQDLAFATLIEKIEAEIKK